MKSYQAPDKPFRLSALFPFSNFTMSCLLVAAMVCTGSATVQAQQTLHCFSYYKVLPGKEQAVRSNMKAVDAKVQQDRVNHGAIAAWYVYETLSPSGYNAEYDYVVVTTTHRYKDLFENRYPFDSAVRKTFLGKGAKFFADHHSGLSGDARLIKEEIYAGVAIADSSSRDGFKFNYLIVDYMLPKPEKFVEYIKMEIDTFRLIHSERIKLGALSQWALLQLGLPFDMKTGYSHLAINFYKDLDLIFSGDSKYDEGLKKTFPTVDLGHLFQSAGAMRNNPKADLLRLVAYALPAN